MIRLVLSSLQTQLLRTVIVGQWKSSTLSFFKSDFLTERESDVPGPFFTGLTLNTADVSEYGDL